MTIIEDAGRYGVPEEILEQYELCGFCCGEQERCDDRDLEKLGLLLSLRDAGFSCEEAQEYMRLCLLGESTREERCRILKKKRCATLEEIHLQEKRLDRLDYLRHRTENGK